MIVAVLSAMVGKGNGTPHISQVPCPVRKRKAEKGSLPTQAQAKCEIGDI